MTYKARRIKLPGVARRVCEECLKVPYTSRENALVDCFDGKAPYKGRYCGYWHIGHPSGKGNRRWA